MTIIIIVASIAAIYIAARPFLRWYEEAKKEGVIKQ